MFDENNKFANSVPVALSYEMVPTRLHQRIMPKKYDHMHFSSTTFVGC